HVAGHVCDEHCGSLEAYSDDIATTALYDGNGAGIGGDGGGVYGTDITIEGGNIEAGSCNGAGIGGGGNGSTSAGGGERITINGGNVTATSTNGAAIGGGFGGVNGLGDGKNIVISGGRVNATSGASVAIGGGTGSIGNQILGGSVNVSGSSSIAGNGLTGFADGMKMHIYTFAGQNKKQVSELKDSAGNPLKNFFNTNYLSDNIRTDESGKIYIWHQGNQQGNTAVCNDSGNIYKSDATGNMTISGQVKYDITVNGGTADSATAAADTSVSITANPPETGKVFDKWTTSDGVTFDNANASTTTFLMPVKAVTVTATYKNATYALTVEHGTGGGSYEANASVQIVANEPATGKVFDKWTSSNGGAFTNVTDVSTTFTMPANATTVKATYKKAPATVTSVTVTPNTAKVEKGETQQFKATVTGANDPAQTVTWAVTGGKSSISESGLLTVAVGETAASLTVTATSTVDPNRSGTATVTPFTKYDLTVTDGTGSGRYAEGAIVTIKAEPLP
ncbi:MAG: Ig-like domain-containing protein, partial [Acinetobacter sp.]